MRPNETVLKVSPLLATPDETNQGHGGPISSLSARSKRGQPGPNGARVHPLLVVPAQAGTSHPFRSLLPLGEG